MTMHIDDLYDLVPAVYRQYDEGQPLRSLLEILAEQAKLIEDDLQRTYDNWFIETCEEWAAPYIGELVGYSPLNSEAAHPDLISVRRDVADTIRNRRRKGTIHILETLASDVAGWPARALEFRRQIAQTCSLRIQHGHRGALADIRDAANLESATTWQSTLARTPDLRRVNSAREESRPGTQSVGLCVWRLKSYSVTRQAASCREEVGPNCFSFSALGNDLPLFVAASDDQLPLRLTKRQLALPRKSGERFRTANPRFWGALESGGTPGCVLWAPGWAGAWPDGLIPPEHVIPANLDGWRFLPPKGHVAVDPELGRIAFPPRQAPRKGVIASYHYGFSGDLGGGEYSRPLSEAPGATLVRVRGSKELEAALSKWGASDGANGDSAEAQQPRDEVIEICDSSVYTLPLSLHIPTESSLQIRAGQRCRPILRLLDWQVSEADNLLVRGDKGSRLTLDGLLVVGRGIQVEGKLRSLKIRHSTLVPGWTLGPKCEPKRPSEPSIEVIDAPTCLTIEKSIVGSIQVNGDEIMTDPIEIRIRDSIVDATGTDCDRPQCEAVGAASDRLAFAVLTIEQSTIIGRLMVHAVELAEDSIFMGRVTVARRQIGCLRFCYVTPGSRTPRRFRCQPDLAEQAADPDGLSAEGQEARADARARVRPLFDSLRSGNATYARLARDCAAEILRGAEGRAEMGAFNQLQNPFRLAALKARLEEFTPAGAEAGIIMAD